MKIGWTGLLAALLAPLAGTTPAAAQTAAAPSFDCARATTAVEQAICDDPALAEADGAMGRLFAATRTSAFGTGPSNMLPGQVHWLKERRDCETVDRRVYKSREACLSDRYDQRNGELAIAALFVEPELALATLRRVDPAMAPLYEALLIYASHPEATDWSSPALAGERTHLLDLLRPEYARLQSEDMRSYGRDILASTVSSLEDALATEDRFSDTIKILAAYVEGKSVPMTMPCAALVRRPGLWMATLGAFGSGLDGGVPLADCATTLPPLPTLDALNAQISAGWPDCQGSIRFMAYRSYDAMVAQARLGSDVSAPGPGEKAVPVPRLKGVQPGIVTAAIAELAAYYVKYRQAAPARARTEASNAVAAILDAGHPCGDGED